MNAKVYTGFNFLKLWPDQVNQIKKQARFVLCQTNDSGDLLVLKVYDSLDDLKADGTILKDWAGAYGQDRHLVVYLPS